MSLKLPVPEFRYLLRQCFSRETSQAPEKWTKERPSFGHCAVASLTAQDFLGGALRRGLVPEEWHKRLGFRSHYWNVLPGGRVEDFTADQFPRDFPYDAFIRGELGGVSDYVNGKYIREYAMLTSSTVDRYITLGGRVEELLESNPLLFDPKFQRCWELAFSGGTKCLKMRFAGLVYDGDRLIVEEVNRHMTEQFGEKRFCELDGGKCIRTTIQSRTDAAIGDCGHALIWSLARVFEVGYKPSDLPKLDFYEGGFKPDGSPWWRMDEEYTCLQCQNTFAIFGLDKVWGTLGNGSEARWVPLYTKDSFYRDAKYALGEKKA